MFPIFRHQSAPPEGEGGGGQVEVCVRWSQGQWSSRADRPAGRATEPSKWLILSRKVLSVEELETFLAGTGPRTPRHRSLGGVTEEWKEAQFDDLPCKNEKGSRQFDQHWN